MLQQSRRCRLLLNKFVGDITFKIRNKELRLNASYKSFRLIFSNLLVVFFHFFEHLNTILGKIQNSRIEDVIHEKKI